MNIIKKLFSDKTSKEIYIALPLILVIFLANVANVLVSKSSATGPDNTFLLVPIFSYISKMFSSGEFPYWLSSVLGGLPIYNSPQFSALYPFYFFKAGLFETPIKAIYHFHYILLFHFLLLYINTYVLLRVIKVTIIPAVFIASLFAFSLNMQQYACWINIIAPYSWFPLAVASIVLATNREKVGKGIILGIISISLLVLASPSQPFIHFVFVSIVIVGYKVFLLIKSKQYKQLIKILIALLIMGGVSIIIVSPVLITTLSAQKDNIRWASNFPPIIGNAKMSFAAFTIGQPNRLDILNVIFPTNKNILLGNPYLGLTVIFLAIFAFFKIKKNQVIILPLYFLAIYSLLSSFGTGFGLAYINYHIPLLNLIREPGRFVILFIFATLALAGYGLDYIVEKFKNGDKKSLIQYIRILLIFLVVSIILYKVAISLGVYPAFSVSLYGAFLLLALPLLLLFFFKKKWGIVLSSIICISVGMKIAQFQWTIPNVKDGDYFSETNLMSHKVLEKISQLEDISEYRVAFEDDINKQNWSMNAIYYGINSLNCYFNPLPYRQFLDMYYHGYNKGLSEILGVKYIICKSEDNKAVQNSKLIFNVGEYKVYANSNALPKVFMVDNIGGYYNDSNDFRTIVANGFDYKRSVLLEKEQYNKINKHLLKDGSKVGSFRKKDESLNKLVLEVNSENDCILVLNQYYDSNWQVQINGINKNIFKVNLNQIGVLVSAGNNVVEFTYKPKLFSYLRLFQQAMIALIAIFLLCDIILIIRNKYSNMKVLKLNG